MSRLNKITQFLFPNLNSEEQTHASSNSDNKLRAENKNPFFKKKGLIRHQLNQRTYRITANLQKWKSAVQHAEDKNRPDRELLYDLYDIVMEDDHLLSQVQTAEYNIQMSPFEIRIKDKADKELKKLFETPWFFEYLKVCMHTELYGHSLVEFTETYGNGNIKSIYLVPRQHVRPEAHIIVVNTGDDKGISYDEGIFQKHLIPVGKDENLGLLKGISKSIIRKNFNLDDWGRKNEKFGMPFVICQTASRNDDELDSKEQMLRNFGSNMWAILDDQDEIEIIESDSSSTGKGHLGYLDYCEYVDKCIALVINGQTGTSDEKSYTGSSEVHERVMNKYTLARLTRIQYHLNFELIPYLVKYHNYPLANATFNFLDLDEEETPDKPVDAKKAPEQDSKKKS